MPTTSIETPPRLRCICGADVPDTLGAPGTEPARCAFCRTPLVRPGKVADWRTQRAFGAAILAAVVCAMSWMLLARWTGTGAPIVVAFAGGVVGLAARAAARARGGAVQVAAITSFLLFMCLGETLLFQRALHPRLVALHAGEGAAEPELEARKEIERMLRMPLDERVELFLHIESSLGLFLAFGAGAAGALLLTRAPAGLAALSAPHSQDAEAPREPEPSAPTEEAAPPETLDETDPAGADADADARPA